MSNDNHIKSNERDPTISRLVSGSILEKRTKEEYDHNGNKF